MRKADRVIDIFTEIAALLRVAGNDNWAKAFDNLRSEFEISPEAARTEILRVYGGIGSFNDVILYRDGQPLWTENGRLSTLRTELYDICREEIG